MTILFFSLSFQIVCTRSLKYEVNLMVPPILKRSVILHTQIKLKRLKLLNKKISFKVKHLSIKIIDNTA